MVFVDVFISIPISAVLWMFFRRNINDPQKRKRHEEKCIIGIIICWIIVFLFPISFGSPGNADVFFKVLMTKTLLMVYTPPFFAFIFSLGPTVNTSTIENQRSENQRPLHYYGSLQGAVRAQQLGASQEGTVQSRPEGKQQAVPKAKPDKYSKYFLTSLLFSPFLFLYAQQAGLDRLAGIFLLTFGFSCFGYLIWLLVRPSQ